MSLGALGVSHKVDKLYGSIARNLFNACVCAFAGAFYGEYPLNIFQAVLLQCYCVVLLSLPKRSIAYALVTICARQPLAHAPRIQKQLSTLMTNKSNRPGHTRPRCSQMKIICVVHELRRCQRYCRDSVERRYLFVCWANVGGLMSVWGEKSNRMMSN